MNAVDVKHTQHHQIAKHLEISVYALLAICFIGHIFFIGNQVSELNVALLTAGTVFGMLVTSGWTPLAERVAVKVPTKLADVFSIGESDKPSYRHNAENRRAA